jgi:pSer/pThr/pTyr-binding forkhead associated (FHA) protein
MKMTNSIVSPIATGVMRVTSYDRPRPATVETAATGRSPFVLLEIRRGAARRRLRPVPGPVYVIGASPECDLVLADPQFPEMHTYLLVDDDGVSLRHLGLEPQITVNGRAVEAAELLDGDRLRTGPYEFRLHLLLAPDGPAASDVADAHRQFSTGRGAAESRAFVGSLLAEIRAALPPSAANPTVSMAAERDAA